MYLSRLILNPRSRAARRDLADCQALHRTVMSAFPDSGADGAVRSRLGVLYRLDTDPRTGVPALLVQSGSAPDWSRLEQGYLLDTGADPPNPATRSLDIVYAALRQGMLLRFRLRANPTRRIGKSQPDGSRWKGKRVELRDEAARLDWLRRKGEQGGFELLRVRANPDVADIRSVQEVKLTGKRPDSGGGAGRLTFGSVLFEGEIRVTDSELFRQSIEQGIGSAKAYGFGLLSIAPPAR